MLPSSLMLPGYASWAKTRGLFARGTSRGCWKWPGNTASGGKAACQCSRVMFGKLSSVSVPVLAPTLAETRGLPLAPLRSPCSTWQEQSEIIPTSPTAPRTLCFRRSTTDSQPGYGLCLQRLSTRLYTDWSQVTDILRTGVGVVSSSLNSLEPLGTRLSAGEDAEEMEVPARIAMPIP